MRTVWTSREERFLRDNIDFLEQQTIADLLGKTTRAVGYKVKLLGLRAKVREPRRINCYWDDKPGSATRAIVSICIKENPSQSLTELAERVAKCINADVSEVYERLSDMHKRGKLGVYDEFYRYVAWRPKHD
jgi:DNA-binding Lrp family transcriptional regulator